MAKRLALSLAVPTLPRFNRGLEAWRIAHDVRNELAGAVLRLQLYERTHPSRAARQAAGLISVALAKLDELEEEDAGIAAAPIGLATEARGRVGHG